MIGQDVYYALLGARHAKDKREVRRLLGELQTSLNCTLVELAEIFGVSEKSVRNWKNGNFLPSVRVLRRITLGSATTAHYQQSRSIRREHGDSAFLVVGMDAPKILSNLLSRSECRVMVADDHLGIPGEVGVMIDFGRLYGCSFPVIVGLGRKKGTLMITMEGKVQIVLE